MSETVAITEPSQQNPAAKKESTTGRYLEALLAAGGTAAGSLLLFMFTQLENINDKVNRLNSTQSVLIDEDGSIRPSVSAIRSQIQLDELDARIQRIENAVVKLNAR